MWDWVKLAEGFGGVGYEVTTNQELSHVLGELRKGSPAPVAPSGPCTDDPQASGCCQFAQGEPTSRRSTFTLVAVRNVCADLPSNTKWKLGS